MRNPTGGTRQRYSSGLKLDWKQSERSSFGVNLLYKAMHGFSAGARAAGTNRAPVAGDGPQAQFRIETVSIERGRLTIGYLDRTWTMSQWKLCAIAPHRVVVLRSGVRVSLVPLVPLA